MTGTRYPIIAALLGVVLLTGGCARPTVRTDSDEAPAQPGFARKGAAVLAFDPGTSGIRVLVYRGGKLASLGHNHVLAVERFGGNVYLHDDLTISGFDLRFQLEDMILDRPADRAHEGEEFASELSTDDIAATRRNMLGEKGLNAERYPEIEIRSLVISGTPPGLTVTTRITMHGVSRNLDVPVTLEMGDREIIASGEFGIRQTDFGITPFSAAFGALVVQDELRVRFRLVAAR